MPRKQYRFRTYAASLEHRGSCFHSFCSPPGSLWYHSRCHNLAGLLFVLCFVFAQEIGTTVHKLLLRMISKSDINEVREKEIAA